jgi:(p)ppGpp synthase/HD superfamily hydrolase
MWDQDLFKRALDFAARAHGAQQVPGSGLPYVVHLAKVATEVLAAAAREPGVDCNLALACALLHDTLEDAGITGDVLRAEFGAAVTAGVRALTKDETLPQAERMADSLERVRAQPREVWMVKLGDRITNLEPPPAVWSVEKRRAYLSEARVILDALRGSSAHLEARLASKIAQYEEYCR